MTMPEESSDPLARLREVVGDTYDDIDDVVAYCRAIREGHTDEEARQIANGEEGSGSGSPVAGVTPIEHEGNAVVMRLAVRELKASHDGNTVIVQATNQDNESGMEFAAAIKNPMVPSLSINDILRIRLEVEEP